MKTYGMPVAVTKAIWKSRFGNTKPLTDLITVYQRTIQGVQSGATGKANNWRDSMTKYYQEQIGYLQFQLNKLNDRKKKKNDTTTNSRSKRKRKARNSGKHG